MPLNVEPDRNDSETTTMVPYSGGCFLCRKESDRVVLREGEMEGRQCSCGLVYAHPLTSTSIKSPLAEHHVDEFYSAPARIKVDWLASHIPCGRLLEVGCGMGHFLAEARRRGFEVTGMEPSSVRATHVRETLEIEVDQSFLHSHGLAEGSFDVVYHCDMLSHCTDPPAALDAMVRLLRPDGVLCLEVGTLGGLDPRWYPWVGGVGLKHHIWLYSRRSLGILFAQAGLDVVAERRFGLAAQIIVPKLVEKSYATAKRLARRGQRRAGSAAEKVVLNSVTDGARPTSHRQRYLERLKFFLRYYVGRLSPRVGPQTYFFVLKPRSGDQSR